MRWPDRNSCDHPFIYERRNLFFKFSKLNPLMGPKEFLATAINFEKSSAINKTILLSFPLLCFQIASIKLDRTLPLHSAESSHPFLPFSSPRCHRTNSSRRWKGSGRSCGLPRRRARRGSPPPPPPPTGTIHRFQTPTATSSSRSFPGAARARTPRLPTCPRPHLCRPGSKPSRPSTPFPTPSSRRRMMPARASSTPISSTWFRSRCMEFRCSLRQLEGRDGAAAVSSGASRSLGSMRYAASSPVSISGKLVMQIETEKKQQKTATVVFLVFVYDEVNE